jgi:hypothetical protein
MDAELRERVEDYMTMAGEPEATELALRCIEHLLDCGRLSPGTFRQLLRDARDELDRHGHGDFHYHPDGYRDPKVLAMLERIDTALNEDV